MFITYKYSIHFSNKPHPIEIPKINHLPDIYKTKNPICFIFPDPSFLSISPFSPHLFLPNMNTAKRQSQGVPSRCWCGRGIVIFYSKTDENPYRRFYRCEIGAQVHRFMNHDFDLFSNPCFHRF